MKFKQLFLAALIIVSMLLGLIFTFVQSKSTSKMMPIIMEPPALIKLPVVVDAAKTASIAAVVAHNFTTKETTVVEKEKSNVYLFTDLNLSTEPYIPDGMEATKILEKVAPVSTPKAIPTPTPAKVVKKTSHKTDTVSLPYPTTEPVATEPVEDISYVTDTNTFPYSAICLLELTYSNGYTEYSTGSLIGEETVLTLAGNIWNWKTEEGWVTSIRVLPGGYESGLQDAYGTDAYVVNGWYRDQDGMYDFGIIKLEKPIGRDTGYFGIQTYSDSFDTSNKNLYQYERWKDEENSNDLSHPSTIEPARRLYTFHNAGALGSGNGGPVLLTNDYSKIIGIHTGGDRSIDYGATRMTVDLYNFIDRCKKMYH